MSVFRRFITRGILWFEQFKGISRVRQLVVIQTTRANSLRVIHQSGYDITIYCQRQEYVKEHPCWLVPKETYRVYHVFSTTTYDAPELIKQACKLEATFPPLLPIYVLDEMHKRAAIDAYVDLLTDKLKALKRSTII